MSILSGVEFKKKYGDTFFKLINKNRKHNNHQYVDGLNEDNIPFNPSGECVPGGLYFTIEEYLPDFINFGYYVVRVFVLDDSQVYIEPEGKKFKANKIIVDLKNKKDKSELLYKIIKNCLEKITFVSDDNIIFKYILLDSKDKPKLLDQIIEKLRNFKVNNRLDEFILEYLLLVLKEKIPDDVYLSIIINNPNYELKFIPDENITYEMCLYAVLKNNDILEYIPNIHIEKIIKNIGINLY